MLIWGISLQLAAGIVLGLPHILGEERLRDANEKLRQFFESLSSGRGRKRILIFGALIIPVATMMTIALAEPAGVQWYEIVGGVLFGYLMVAAFYLASLKRLARLISKGKDLRALPDDVHFRTLLFSNLILIAIFAGFASLAWLILWGNSPVSIANIGNIPQVAILSLSLLLVFIFVFCELSAGISIAFVVLAGIVGLVSLMAKAKGPLWIMVLLLYVLGGAFLIVSACRS
jgi:hypothetical protein